jgi:CheY-like chemotaxis protein
MNAGADDYLPKPFRPAELIEAADALLRRRRTQYEAIAGSLMEDMDAALAHQREQLASRYETQLLQELNSKWKVDVEAGQEIVFDSAIVIVADLFSVLERESAGRPDAAELLQRAHQAASDALYLFGAVHVVPHGQTILAVFRTDTHGRPNLANALRAAFGLQTAVTNVLAAATGGGNAALAIGLDTGPARWCACATRCTATPASRPFRAPRCKGPGPAGTGARAGLATGGAGARWRATCRPTCARAAASAALALDPAQGLGVELRRPRT